MSYIGFRMPEPPLEPTEREPRFVLYCDLCGEEIYEFDEYYRFPGMNVCEACAAEHKTEAVIE